ncbi:hypothetical protein CA267_005075 [Alteromonas pelagimontana]|uniref:Glycosyltransferase family 4 protein n=1 Tax=Alteromonas pelagimontana TaxID=1858656 RepID=A0A6M4MAG4_9ALTE|nr:hypothetical protein [Alteromonas pelagimontana]QJR80191.1 hypothetical protein CA267_005075 [Alteromonas pelagimontana]
MYPIEHNNSFIARTRTVFEELNFRVKPLKRLFALSNVRNRKANTVVLNWYEDQPYRKGLGGAKRLLFVIGFFISILSLRLFSNNIQWVRHNFKPHNTAGKPLLFRFTLRLLSAVTDQVVTLEATDKFDSSVVKHPLYKNEGQLYQYIAALGSGARNIEYLYFGSIKPYKRLDALLNVWPQPLPLKIMGFCSDKSYTQQLHEIVAARRLSVDWVNEFVEDAALEEAVATSRFVIMAHDDDAMISSGTFYMALSLGANILCFDSAFARLKSKEFSFVKIISPENLQMQLAAIDYVDSHIVISKALEKYNEQAIRESWQAILST